eukprot:TRINITY_DN106471_c0_g1_i1.p1 TRINITY_DN106471_c0_g1~~TRINITY_DN106471_c0_g1_i1.p1  ORF type:complete len:456 (-),score=82.30 TRINITY_DN106471_c0_g1_i1:30-1397(-)
MLWCTVVLLGLQISQLIPSTDAAHITSPDKGSSKPTVVAYYINMRNEVKRRVHMQEQAEASRMPLKRFEAVERDRIGSGEFDSKYVLRQGLADELKDKSRLQDHVPNATVACYVSHSELLESLQRQLHEDQVALVLEDDVQIPPDWHQRIEKTLACAPADWALLKVSGWGYTRVADLQERPPQLNENSTGLGVMAWLESKGGWMSRLLFGAPEAELPTRNSSDTAATQMFVTDKSQANSAEADGANCPDAFLMRAPFKESPWWHFWGPAFHYAGTGAYLVKASGIPRVLAHLRSQPINDIDGMLLSSGNLRAFEMWPHIFPLTMDHMRSTMLAESRGGDEGFVAKLANFVIGQAGNQSGLEVNHSKQLLSLLAELTRTSRLGNGTSMMRSETEKSLHSALLSFGVDGSGELHAVDTPRGRAIADRSSARKKAASLHSLNSNTDLDTDDGRSFAFT